MQMNELVWDRLEAFVNTPPGFDLADYSDHRSYRSDVRLVQAQRRRAHMMIAFAREKWPTGDLWVSSRLEWNGTEFGYTVGQYRPVEYRACVCLVIAQYIWQELHSLIPDVEERREYLKKHFGRSMQRRYWN